MNRIDARAVPHQGMFIGRFRRVHKAEYETVQKDGEPVLFATEAEAERAAWRAMTAHLTTLMRRDGIIIGRDQAETAWQRITRKADGEEAAGGEEGAYPGGRKVAAAGIEARGPR